MTVKGHCLCGAVRFELDGPPNWVGHCHCDSCRRATGAPLVTFVGHPDGQWRWTGKEPSVYASSPGTRRTFCPTCGASVTYATDNTPGETHFHATLLDDPASVQPTEIDHADERLPWMPADYPGCGKL
ncbi:GFA family protein [Roseovarius sp.]|uniref:GFA family protein n=1 Tax=Roseovarius sp. TaxID=1486281 RepID=UPI002612008A|nr:GFA family protein [Roseovarius sp.]MDM8164437.1 GFA family protein [Roseovarius sp.]